MPPSTLSIKKTVRSIIDEAFDIKRNIKTAWERADRDRRDGFPDRNGDALGVQSSDTTDATSALALGPPDQIERTQATVIEHLYAAQRHLMAAKRQTLDLAGLDHATAQHIAEEQTRKTSDCINCGRIITGARDDRPVNGRCDACYRYHKDNGRDRTTKTVIIDGKRQYIKIQQGQR